MHRVESEISPNKQTRPAGPQIIICSDEVSHYFVSFKGTTMFNGEAVSGASGASVLPPVTPSPTASTTSNKSKFSKESFEEMRQAPGLKSGDMKDPLNFLDPLWSLKKK